MNRSAAAPVARDLARDLAPAVVIAVVVSLVVTSQVSAADGMLALLVAVGLLAVVAATFVALRLESDPAGEPAASTGVGGAQDSGVGSAPLGGPTFMPATGAAFAAGRPGPAAGAAGPARWPAAPAKPILWQRSAALALRHEPLAVSVPKLGNTDEENEDACAFDRAAGRVVVADGASSSFASREWSRALCAEVLHDAAAVDSAGGLGAAATRAAERWRAAVGSGGDVAWWAKQGLERGAFATFIAVEVARVGKKEGWRAAAVGDSCVLQLRHDGGAWQIVTSFPVQPGEEFTSHPDLLQTSAPDDVEGLRWAKGELAAGDVLVVATDAVSEWALTSTDPRTLALLAEAGPEELARELVRRREADEIVNDDCTLVRILTTPQLR